MVQDVLGLNVAGVLKGAGRGDSLDDGLVRVNSCGSASTVIKLLGSKEDISMPKLRSFFHYFDVDCPPQHPVGEIKLSQR
jgi:hypothetical protein